MAQSITSSQISQANAYRRAEEQAALGNRPALCATIVNPAGVIVETWRVMSRTAEGHAYHVELLENQIGVVRTSCDCPAPGCCWHRAAARLARRGAIGYDNECGVKLTHKRPAISAAMLSGKA